MLLGSHGLEEHADDGHHGKSSVGDFRIELLSLLSRIAGSEDLESEVTGVGRSAGLLRLRHLAVGHVQKDLSPSGLRNLGDGSKAVRDVRELKAGRWA